MSTKSVAAAVAPLQGLLGFRLARLSNTLARASDLRYAREFGVTVAEWRCLASLASLSQASVAQLCALTLTDKAWVSRTLTRLAQRGLVVQRADERDARRVVARLTSRGRRVATQVMQAASERNDELLAALGAQQAATLLVSLERLQASADAILVRERNAAGSRPPTG